MVAGPQRKTQQMRYRQAVHWIIYCTVLFFSPSECVSFSTLINKEDGEKTNFLVWHHSFTSLATAPKTATPMFNLEKGRNFAKSTSLCRVFTPDTTVNRFDLHNVSNTWKKNPIGSIYQAGLRNIEEEAASELHRTISGDLLNEDEMDGVNDEEIFRVNAIMDKSIMGIYQ